MQAAEWLYLELEEKRNINAIDIKWKSAIIGIAQWCGVKLPDSRDKGASTMEELMAMLP